MTTLKQSSKLTKTKTAAPIKVSKIATKKGSAVATKRTLAACEKSIESHLEGTLKHSRAMGEEMKYIRDNKLYTEGNQRGTAYTTFENYCERRWDTSIAHVKRLMTRVETEATLNDVLENEMAPIGAISEGVAREYAPLRRDPARLRTVHREVVDEYGDEPTAKQVRQVRERTESKAPLVPYVEPTKDAAKTVEGLLRKALDFGVGENEARSELR